MNLWLFGQFTMTTKKLCAVIFLIGLTSHSAVSGAIKSVEVFGRLPSIRSVMLSPDGKHVAFIKSDGEQEFLNYLNAWITARDAEGWLSAKHKFWFESLDWKNENDDANTNRQY